MSKEYIEREAAIEWFMAFVLMGESEIPAETVIMDLKYAITDADVAPVQHAKWDANGRCTNCGGHAPFYSMTSTYHESPYCFECGAKMDKEENP